MVSPKANNDHPAESDHTVDFGPAKAATHGPKLVSAAAAAPAPKSEDHGEATTDFGRAAPNPASEATISRVFARDPNATTDFANQHLHHGHSIDLAKAGNSGSLNEQIQPGTTVELGTHSYIVTAKLGEGGQGVAFAANQTDLNRQVAIKKATINKDGSSDPKNNLSIAREAQSLAHVEHPNIVPIYNLEKVEKKDETGKVTGEEYWFVYKLIKGSNLEERLKKNPLTPHEGALLVSKIASALQEVHDCELIHRDVKPANILIDQKNIPYLADFGMAMSTKSPPEGSALCAGTPGYMSPEQAINGLLDAHKAALPEDVKAVFGSEPQVDQRSDVYGLGIVLHEILSGGKLVLPPQKEHEQMRLKRVAEANITPPVADQPLPEELVRICMKAVEKDPAKRYQSAADMAQDLDAFLEREKDAEKEKTRAAREAERDKERELAEKEKERLRRRRTRNITTGVLAAGIGVSAVAGVLVGRRGSDDATPSLPTPPAAVAKTDPPAPPPKAPLKTTLDDLDTLRNWPVTEGKNINIMELLDPLYRRGRRLTTGPTLTLLDADNKRVDVPNNLDNYTALNQDIVGGRGDVNDLKSALARILTPVEGVTQLAQKYAGNEQKPFGLTPEEMRDYFAAKGIEPTKQVMEKVEDGVALYVQTIADYRESAEVRLRKMGELGTTAPTVVKGR